MSYLFDPITIPRWAFFVFVLVWMICGLMLVRLRLVIRDAQRLQKRIKTQLDAMDEAQKERDDVRNKAWEALRK